MQKLYCLCSASESRKQNPPDKATDLPFLFHLKHITPLKKAPSPTQRDSLSYRIQTTFCGCVCFELLDEGISLPAIANHFEMRCEQMQMMLLHYKIWPCSSR